MNVKKIHWIGVGLSSPPGILHLIKHGHNLEVWNRTTEKASKSLNHKININKFDLEKLRLTLNPDDLIISMLPADKHLDIAKIAKKLIPQVKKSEAAKRKPKVKIDKSGVAKG